MAASRGHAAQSPTGQSAIEPTIQFGQPAVSQGEQVYIDLGSDLTLLESARTSAPGRLSQPPSSRPKSFGTPTLTVRHANERPSTVNTKNKRRQNGKIRRIALARVLGGACASVVIVALTGTSPASGADLVSSQHQDLTFDSLPPSAAGGKWWVPREVHHRLSGGLDRAVDGDVNPYGVAVVPKTVGHLGFLRFDGHPPSGHRPGKDVQNGDHGTEEAQSS